MYNWARSFGLAFVILTKKSVKTPDPASSSVSPKKFITEEFYDYKKAEADKLNSDKSFEAFEKVASLDEFRYKYKSLVTKINSKLNYYTKQLVVFMLCGCMGDDMKKIYRI